jgi:hypothetical protein
MTAKNDVRLAVLKVLGGQSPGYFIFPNASAFVAEGLDPAEVADTLDELHREGKLERELLPVGDPGGDGEMIPGGYRLTDQEEDRNVSDTENVTDLPAGDEPGEPEPDTDQQETDEEAAEEEAKEDGGEPA